MNYLFLDLECSNGSDICSVGYVLTDDKFNLIEQNDVLINPESRFVLTNHAGTQGITLAYKPEVFYAAPTFPKKYEWLKNLLEDGSVTVIGFAVSNDAGFIRKACERYSLPQINFSFFDTQRLDAALHTGGEIRSLSKIIDMYEIEQDEENILHKSDDDAFFTMEIFVKMLGETGLTADKLFEAYPGCQGESKDGCIGYDGLAIGSVDKMRKKDVIVFRMHCDELRTANKGVGGALTGKKICFARNFENKNYRKMMIVADKIYSLGGRLSSLRDCNMFVSLSEENSQTVSARETGAEIVPYEQFPVLIGLSVDELNAKAEEFDIMPLKKVADKLKLPPVRKNAGNKRTDK